MNKLINEIKETITSSSNTFQNFFRYMICIFVILLIVEFVLYVIKKIKSARKKIK